MTTIYKRTIIEMIMLALALAIIYTFDEPERMRRVIR